MRRTTVIVTLVSVLMLAATLAIRPFALTLAKAQLDTIFPDSTIEIGKCHWDPRGRLTFVDIRIGQHPGMVVTIQEGVVRYHWPDILSGRIDAIILSGADARVNLPQKTLSELLSTVPRAANHSGPKTSAIKSLRFVDCKLMLKTREFKLQGVASLEMDLQQRALTVLDLQVKALERDQLILKNASVRAGGSEPGQLRIEQISFQKLSILGAQGRVRLTADTLSGDLLTGHLWDGQVGGAFFVTMAQPWQYRVNLRLTRLNIQRLVQDLELKKKFDMSGSLSGDIMAQGEGPVIQELRGDLSLGDAGGKLVIEDTRFLENLSRTTGQSVELLIDSFKDYHYNAGAVTLSLQGDAVRLDVLLDGGSGKRNLQVVFHDLFKRKDRK